LEAEKVNIFLKGLYAIYTFLPAYFANATPTILGGGKPVDFKRNFIDGRRLFGDNKTIRGFVSGVFAGTVVGILQGEPLRGALLSLGALIGDLGGAFVKRRFGLDPGAPLPLLDQLDFVAGALILSVNFFPIDVTSMILIIVLTPFIHFLTNTIAYALKLKSRPW